MKIESNGALELKEGTSSAELLSASQVVCFHCLEPVPKYGSLSAIVAGVKQPMCCVGCKSAAEFIEQQGLSRFYEHRGRLSQSDFFGQLGQGLAVTTMQQSSRWDFLDDPDGRQGFVQLGSDGALQLTIAVQGLYCRSCSWLIDRALRSISADIESHIEVDARIINLEIKNAGVSIAAVVSTIERLGYKPVVLQLGRSDSGLQAQKLDQISAIRRIAVAGFGMMQVMTYAVAGYFSESSALAMAPQYERFFVLVSMLVSTVVVFYSGRPFFSNALNDIRNRHLGMDVPIALAIAGAYFPSVFQVLAHGSAPIYFDSAVMFVFFLSLGRYFEMRARRRLSGATDDVQQLLPNQIEITRVVDGARQTLSIHPVDVKPGDTVQLPAGEIIPFDATIRHGSGQVDESLVSGESIPKYRSTGDSLLAGSRLCSGTMLVAATHHWPDSSIAKVQKSLQQAQRLEHQESTPMQFVTRYFVLVVLLLTIVVGLVWWVIEPARTFEVCLAMLIAACPCAFSLAAPLGRAAAINRLKKAGVLLTSSRPLTTLAAAGVWFFDKTGTLTQGRPQISQVVSYSKLTEQECLALVASIEQSSTHTLASAFRNIATGQQATAVHEVVGCGISAQIAGAEYFVGKPSWVKDQIAAERQLPDPQPLEAQILLANDREILAAIVVADSLRPSSYTLVNSLQRLGKQVAMLSGDSAVNVQAVGRELGIENLAAEQMPSDKLARITAEQRAGNTVAMVGDGVNDAPVLAAADVSIVLASGSELAINNADVVLLNGKLQNLLRISEIGLRTTRITRQNLVWALAYNCMVLPLAAGGLLTPWIAALGMSLSSLLVVINATRI